MPIGGGGGELGENPLDNIPEDFRVEDIKIERRGDVLTK